MDVNKQKLDEILAAGRKPEADISLLHARILKATAQIPQDEPAVRTLYGHIASWKSVAATLILTTGLGFGLGQIFNENSAYISAETLLSMSFVNDYDDIGIVQNLTGDQP